MKRQLNFSPGRFCPFPFIFMTELQRIEELEAQLIKTRKQLIEANVLIEVINQNIGFLIDHNPAITWPTAEESGLLNIEAIKRTKIRYPEMKIEI